MPAAAAPCAFGAAYDPACDVDQDGDIDVFDIQLTAGHWNQTGTWTGGGDGWLLTGNAGTNPTTNFIGTTDGQPLVMQPVGGNVGIGTRAPGARFNVVGTSWFQGDSTPLPAAAGKGIAIGFTGEQGYIYGFDYATWTHKNLCTRNVPPPRRSRAPTGSTRAIRPGLQEQYQLWGRSPPGPRRPRRPGAGTGTTAEHGRPPWSTARPGWLARYTRTPPRPPPAHAAPCLRREQGLRTN
ncbi:hypothetical protein [Candidatus Amarolinea dominans]|uniref:hypothetical protein n=1 Tax=Candidatus Amarolinea dominans TaxID=3140696 RepID=UPI001D1D938C|nr:hypothetical protein [Anaerolineae bacterium]